MKSLQAVSALRRTTVKTASPAQFALPFQSYNMYITCPRSQYNSCQRLESATTCWTGKKDSWEILWCQIRQGKVLYKREQRVPLWVLCEQMAGPYEVESILQRLRLIFTMFTFPSQEVSPWLSSEALSQKQPAISFAWSQAFPYVCADHGWPWGYEQAERAPGSKTLTEEVPALPGASLTQHCQRGLSFKGRLERGNDR